MWQPSTPRATLVARAELLAKLRRFFAEHDVLEVDVPILGASTVCDPHIASASLELSGNTYFLQTSPEFFMKRLLASGAGSIFYLGKAVRDDPLSRRHNPEFSLLEWYREGFDDRQLMAEVSSLFEYLEPGLKTQDVSYASLFEEHFSCNPHRMSNDELAVLAKRHVNVSWDESDNATWLDLLFSHVIEPTLQDPTIVYDYPECMCALARLGENDQGDTVAKRFEVFWKGLELANAYWELCDSEAQRARFESDLEKRKHLALPMPDIDEKFMAALEEGLPDCAGIALGVDRLLMCLLDADDIEQVMCFPVERL